MYTRCKACHTVYPVNATLLTRAKGAFRCGKCNKAGNALDALFDEWPAASESPAAPGDLPVLGIQLDLRKAARSRREGELAGPADGADGDHEPGVHKRSWLIPATWISGALVLSLAVTWQLLTYFGGESKAADVTRSALVSLGLAEAPATGPARNLDRIEVVSRQMQERPGRPGMLQLAATIVNRAAQAQPFPEIELLIQDADGRPLERRRFTPADYLAAGADLARGMAPQAHLPLLLELEDPGPEAVGFELRFH
ncbi:MAG: zinc-ribbon and DUF3426 domain-containing protein [Xanthomonadales bacterium]|nr:zinc-ribbon and DUF3426 domain-containing protein [Xanthomonadales bacterium]